MDENRTPGRPSPGRPGVGKGEERRGTSVPDPEPVPGILGSSYLVYFGEDHGTHISQVGSFSVDGYTGHVSVCDVAGDPAPGR